MKITKIEIQKKNKDRLNIFVNEEFEMGVDQATYVHFNLRKGLEVNQELINDIKDYDNYRQAINKAIIYLSHKKRTKKEIESYLEKQEFSSTLIQQVIQYCEKNGYIEHEDYIESLKNTIIKTTDKGPDHFERVANEKGIETSLINKYKDKFIEEMPEDRIRKIAQKVMNKKKQPPNKLKQTIFQTLKQKGYSFDIINEQLNELEIEPTSEDVGNILEKDLEKVYNKYYRKYDGHSLKMHVIQALIRKGYTYEMIQEKMIESGIVDE